MTGGNPLLDLHRAAEGSPSRRDEALRRFAFAIPDDAALTAVERAAPSGVIELGAGTGYWANQLAQRGVDIIAYDVEPAPSHANCWFADTQPWFPVRRGDEGVVEEQPHRCLLLVWPTRNETWPAAAVERFHAAGGRSMVYVGEPPGGRSGDDVFHRLIGELDRCVHCDYGVLDSPCLCGVPILFRAAERVPIPTWVGFNDELIVLRR